MTKEQIRAAIRPQLISRRRFTSTGLAAYLWPDLCGTDPPRPSFHPYAAQISIVLKESEFSFVKFHERTGWYYVD